MKIECRWSCVPQRTMKGPKRTASWSKEEPAYLFVFIEFDTEFGLDVGLSGE